MTYQTTDPPYYRKDGFQLIDFIEKFDLNFSLGNAVKYVVRAGRKKEQIEDLEKALWYMARVGNQMYKGRWVQPVRSNHTTYFYFFVGGFDLPKEKTAVLFQLCRMNSRCSINQAINLTKEMLNGIRSRPIGSE